MVEIHLDLIYAYKGTDTEGHATFAGGFDAKDDYTLDLPHKDWEQMGYPLTLTLTLGVPVTTDTVEHP